MEEIPVLHPYRQRALLRSAHEQASSVEKGIQNLQTGPFKIRDISCHHGQLMPMGSGGDLAVKGGDDYSFFFPFGLQLSPNVRRARIEAENPSSHASAKQFEPILQERLAGTTGQPLYATSHFSDGDRADI